MIIKSSQKQIMTLNTPYDKWQAKRIWFEKKAIKKFENVAQKQYFEVT